MKLYTSRDDPAIVTLKNNSIERTTAAGLNITIDTIFMKKKNLSYNDYNEKHVRQGSVRQKSSDLWPRNGILEKFSASGTPTIDTKVLFWIKPEP